MPLVEGSLVGLQFEKGKPVASIPQKGLQESLPLAHNECLTSV